jgi:protein phosphatase
VDLASDWLLLDCELMPWSAKAQALLQTQYAAVGAAGRAALHVTTADLQQSAARIPEVQTLLERYGNRAEMVDRYITAYRAYCWLVHSLQDLKLASFHVLARGDAVHIDKNHLWHMEMAARLCAVILNSSRRRRIRLFS